MIDVGVYAILNIIKNYKPYVLFTTDEETGALGATAFTTDIKELPVNFIIEIDRRGFQQAVFYECDNQKFKDFITSFGFGEHWGTFTDISIISPKYDIASVNLSAGYYNEHTKQEYISLKDLQYTINAVKDILSCFKDKKASSSLKFKYEKKVYNYDYSDETWEDFWFKDFTNLSDDDWFKYYGFAKPATFKEVKEILGVE